MNGRYVQMIDVVNKRRKEASKASQRVRRNAKLQILFVLTGFL